MDAYASRTTLFDRFACGCAGSSNGHLRAQGLGHGAPALVVKTGEARAAGPALGVPAGCARGHFSVIGFRVRSLRVPESGGSRSSESKEIHAEDDYV
jgi:hypothetical protein